ncbi:hypothetical protein LTS16_023299 [Friedmanniomyces endolithicus]|nr:hypothetical protein LTS16_023299 [Friedmanniomyces endolithicus]
MSEGLRRYHARHVLTPSAVVTGNSLTIFLAYDDPANNGAFCCVAPYNSTSAQCQFQTAGSYVPFDMDAFQVIYDRSTGATIPIDGSNPTTTANSSGAATVTTTATATATGTSGTSVAAVAAGVAAPLGVLLLASLIACGILLSRLKKLRREHHTASGTSHIVGGGGMGHHAMAAGSMPYDYKSVPQEQQSGYGSGWSQAGMSPRPVAPVEAPATMEIGEADSRPITGQKR